MEQFVDGPVPLLVNEMVATIPWCLQNAFSNVVTPPMQVDENPSPFQSYRGDTHYQNKAEAAPPLGAFIDGFDDVPKVLRQLAPQRPFVFKQVVFCASGDVRVGALCTRIAEGPLPAGQGQGGADARVIFRVQPRR